MHLETLKNPKDTKDCTEQHINFSAAKAEWLSLLILFKTLQRPKDCNNQMNACEDIPNPSL